MANLIQIDGNTGIITFNGGIAPTQNGQMSFYNGSFVHREGGVNKTLLSGSDTRLPPTPATMGKLVYDTGASYSTLALPGSSGNYYLQNTSLGVLSWVAGALMPAAMNTTGGLLVDMAGVWTELASPASDSQVLTYKTSGGVQWAAPAGGGVKWWTLGNTATIAASTNVYLYPGAQSSSMLSFSLPYNCTFTQMVVAGYGGYASTPNHTATLYINGSSTSLAISGTGGTSWVYTSTATVAYTAGQMIFVYFTNPTSWPITNVSVALKIQ